VSSVHHDCLRRWLVEVCINSLYLVLCHVIHMHTIIAVCILMFVSGCEHYLSILYLET
jgi:hypothetical protein